MRPVLLDSDAFRCLHGLRLLDSVCAALAPHTRITLTGYIAKHELNLLQREVDRLSRTGMVHLQDVIRGTEAFRRYREFQRACDKGEAEAIAFALDEPRPTRALFITRDDGARRFAEQKSVPVTDVMGLVVEACLVGGLDRSVAAQALSVWDDRGQQLCRPADYDGFDKTFSAREIRRLEWCDPRTDETIASNAELPTAWAQLDDGAFD